MHDNPLLANCKHPNIDSDYFVVGQLRADYCNGSICFFMILEPNQRQAVPIWDYADATVDFVDLNYLRKHTVPVENPGG